MTLQLGRILAISLIILAVISPSRGSAWWGFGHYRVAMEVKKLRPDLNVDVDYSMVPDAFASRGHSGGEWETPFGVSVNFTWSHAVQRMDGEAPPPSAPMYPADGRHPGPVMYELASRKVNYTSMIEKQRAISCAKGSLVHNAADHIVHWQYFRGDGDPVFGVNMWVRNHCTKEEWASYVLVMLLDAGVGSIVDPGCDGMLGTDDDTVGVDTSQLGNVFNGSGAVKWQEIYGNIPEAGNLGTLGLMTFKIEAPIMHLAMKAHRKNRRNSDFQGASEFSVLSQNEITSVAGNEFNLPGAEFSQEVLRMNIARWFELDFKAKCLQVASECDSPTLPFYPASELTWVVQPWSVNDVVTKFNSSVSRAIAWLDTVDD